MNYRYLMKKNTSLSLVILILTFFSNIKAEINNSNEQNLITDKVLKWYSIPEESNKLIWKRFRKIKNNKNTLLKKTNKTNKKSKVTSYGRAITFNSIDYPEISSYVPNAYIQDDEKKITSSLRLISKTRHCNGKNFSNECADGLLDLDFNILKKKDYSLNTKVSFQSLTDRGTEFGDGISLGFKLAKEVNSQWSMAIGGENIIHFDDTIDLGRNFYIVASTYRQIGDKSKENSPVLFLNAGLGSDFYGYRGNGFLFRTPCLGNNTLTANADSPNSCSWGPIGSVALSLNNRFSIINEWFGYGYGTGFSIRPFKDSSVSLSLFATDFINGFPKYAKEKCPNNTCSSRFYGTISLTF